MRREVIVNPDPDKPSPPSPVVIVVVGGEVRLDVLDPWEALFPHSVFEAYAGYRVYYVFKDLYVAVAPGDPGVSGALVDAWYGRELWRVAAAPAGPRELAEALEQCRRNPKCSAYTPAPRLLVRRWIRLLNVEKTPKP